MLAVRKETAEDLQAVQAEVQAWKNAEAAQRGVVGERDGLLQVLQVIHGLQQLQSLWIIPAAAVS